MCGEHVLVAHAGDEAAREAIFEAWLPVVLGWCARLGRPKVDAEDAAHDVFLVVIRRLENMEQPEQFAAWLFGITRRVLRQHRRRAWITRWQANWSLEEAPDAKPGAEASAGSNQLCRQVWRILDELPPSQGEVLILAAIEDRPLREVAEILNVPEGTVASRVRLARAKFERLARARGSASRIRRRPMKDPLVDAFERSTASTPFAASRVKDRVQTSVRDGASANLGGPYTRFGGMAVAMGDLVLVAFVLVKSGPPTVPVYSVESLEGGIGAYRGATAPSSREISGLDRRPMGEPPGPSARPQVKDSSEVRGATALVFDPNSVIRWIARPLRDVPDAQRRLRASLFTRSPNGEEQVVEGNLRPSPSGAYTIRRPASEYCQRQFGAWELRLVMEARGSTKRVLRSAQARGETSFQIFESNGTYVPIRGEMIDGRPNLEDRYIRGAIDARRLRWGGF